MRAAILCGAFMALAITMASAQQALFSANSVLARWTGFPAPTKCVETPGRGDVLANIAGRRPRSTEQTGNTMSPFRSACSVFGRALKSARTHGGPCSSSRWRRQGVHRAAVTRSHLGAAGGRRATLEDDPQRTFQPISSPVAQSGVNGLPPANQNTVVWRRPLCVFTHTVRLRR